MKHLKRLLILLYFVVSIFIIIDYSPKAVSYEFENKWLNPKRPLIIPHGGAKMLYPENTIYAFEQTDIYDAFEIDLTLTKDDILMTHHDLDLSLDLGASFKDTLVRTLTYDEIIQTIKDNDYPGVRNFVDIHGNKPYENVLDPELLDKLIPAKLEDIFKKYRHKFYILELKDIKVKEDYEKATHLLIDLIEKYDLSEQVIVSSFSDEVMKYFKKQTHIHTSTAFKKSLNFILLSAFNVDFFYRPNDAALIIPNKEILTDKQLSPLKYIPKFIQHKFMDKNQKNSTHLGQSGIINDAHRHNMAVIYWTINDVDEMKELIKLGVDGIITDRPDILHQLYLDLGLI